ncbi:MAG: transposase [Bacteroidetes bacterium]|nr:transposase [Bacteroidota bacterium]
MKNKINPCCVKQEIEQTVKFRQKYKIATSRLTGYDYGSNGFYYVTICTNKMIHFFGKIVETHNCASLQKTQIGQISEDYWQRIPMHYPFVEVDEFIIMPNHIHGILFFNLPEKKDWIFNQFGKQSQNLGSVIRAFKSSVKRYANQNHIEFSWQPRFYDRIIRNNTELNTVRQYIIDNPTRWGKTNMDV